MNKGYEAKIGNCMESKGFIAITVTLFVTGILMALVFTSSIETGLFYDMAMKKKYRTLNYFYAGDCIDQAIVMLAHDYFFTIKRSIEINKYHCSILSIKAEGEIRIITVMGQFKDAYVFRKASVRLKDHDLEIIRLE